MQPSATERRRRALSTRTRCVAVALLGALTGAACATSTCASDAAAREQSGELRDPALWPFASDSPWNTPLGTDAVFATSEDPRAHALRDVGPDAWVNAGKYSQPVSRAQLDDPVRTIKRPGHPKVSFRIPIDARPASGTDANLNVIDPTGRWIDELWLAKPTDFGFKVGSRVRNDTRGSGVGKGGGRAYGGSAIGGLIRAWELNAGQIRHALALGITAGQLGRGPIWPATLEDADASSSYSGTIPMGTLVALPPDVGISDLGLTSDGIVLARALRDFGAYVVDRSGSVSLYAEPSLEGTPALREMRQAWSKLRPLLNIVNDNGPRSVGGSGRRRTAPAPPLFSVATCAP